jgi:hypothetical protein
MRRLNKESLFSATACCERYNAIIEGTARIPTEVDDDPDARRAEMEDFRMSREKTRIKDQTEKDAQEAEATRNKREAKALSAQKAEDIAEKRAAKEFAKAQRAMTRAAQAQIRFARATENKLSKAHRNAQLKTRNEAKEAKEAKKNKNTPMALTKSKKETPKSTDPRSYLSLKDLQKMCEDRGLEFAEEEDKDSLVKALVDADEEYNQAELKKMCRSKGLNANVSKFVMKKQLALHSAKACGSYESGVAGTTAEDDGDDEMDMDEE